MSSSEGSFFTAEDDELEIPTRPHRPSDDPCSETSVAPSPVPSDLEIVARTKRGAQREINEDFPVWCADPANTKFRLLLADGMGGAPRGELASQQLGPRRARKTARCRRTANDLDRERVVPGGDENCCGDRSNQGAD